MLTTIVLFSIQYLPWVIAAIFIGFLFSRNIVNQKGQVAIFALFTGVIAFAIEKVLNQIVVSPRPFVVESVAPLIPHVADNGFPSEHTLFVFVLAIVVSTYNKSLGYVLVVLALLVGGASILAKVHSPIDVLGSIAIGIASLWISQRIIVHPKIKNVLTKGPKIKLL